MRASGSAAFPDRIGGTLLCSADGFRGLLESFQFRPLQKLGDIQEDNQAAAELADPGDTARVAFRNHRPRGFDFRGRNLQHFRCGVNDEADQFVFQFHDQDTAFLAGLSLATAESLAQVHYGDDFPPEIDDTLDHLRRAGNSGNLRNADDFADGADADAVRFVADAETNNLQFLFHRAVSASSRMS